MNVLFDSVESVLIKYSLVTAFAVVGITVWGSYTISKGFTKGRLHGSAIAIFIGLLLAYISGTVTGSAIGATSEIMALSETGHHRIMGRLSVDIIKSGGYKLSALEIEAALLEQPAIAECAVVGVADDTWGEAVAVAAVLAAGEELDLETLRA